MNEPCTIAPGEQIPKGLACRLAAHYSKSVTDDLARFYWTGQVHSHGGDGVRRAYRVGQHTVDAKGKNDPQAVAAELRALANYLDDHAGQHAQPGWLDYGLSYQIEWDCTVPWSWR